MSPRNQFLLTIAILTLIAGISLFTFLTRDREPDLVFPASIDRDCAPWDGAAFTVSIPIEEAVIKISIYQSPDIMFPVTFSLPDDTMRAGNALLLLPEGLPEQLTGKVSFQRVEQGITVEGWFDFVTNAGGQFKGMFIAEWGNDVIYCG